MIRESRHLNIFLFVLNIINQQPTGNILGNGTGMAGNPIINGNIIDSRIPISGEANSFVTKIINEICE